MRSYQNLHDLNVVQTLGDSRRLEILQRLMVGSATLSQLGAAMGMHPAQVRYHLKRLEAVNLVTFVSSREVRGFVEKYYAATARAFFVNQAILPQFDQEKTVVFLGSHDPSLELITAHLEGTGSGVQLMALPVGSMEGLIALRHGLCQITGCHLYDPIDEVYNTSYVRHFFPGKSMHLVTLAHRLQGLLVLPGNPKKIQGVKDLGRLDLTMVNRESGSGTRLWLDQQIKTAGIDPRRLNGYDREVNTHSRVAEMVSDGQADVGLAVFAAAKRYKLDFIPLFEERFDFVIPADEFHSSKLSPVMDLVNSKQFKNDLLVLGGYDPHDTGKETLVN